MPEIAEVEYARQRIHDKCIGFKIAHVEAKDDPLVISGISSTEFSKILEGRTIRDTTRRGKYFVLMLDGNQHIVAHFGMTGNIYFAEERKEGATWPPRFWKAILTMEKEGAEKVTLAFDDSRRLGRIRIVTGDPLSQPPISKLGFDPLFNHPDKDTFMALVQKRNMPIKALLLDQSFSAGVGNWVADEILYHSRLHPGQYANTLSSDQCDTLRVEIERVCRIAVEAEADSSKFPEDWLMAYRWKKGKGKGGGKLPNGHKLDFITVGGRTSAYVPALQKLTGDTSQKKKKKRRSAADDEKDGSKEKGNTKKSKKNSGYDEEADDEVIAPKSESRAERYARRADRRKRS